MGEEDGLALEMRPGLERLHRLIGALAAGFRRRHAVELREMASKGDQRRRCLRPCFTKALKLGKRLRRIATARGVDEILERRLRGIADDRFDVVVADACPT